MPQDERIDKLAESLASGLRDDAELELDVRRELQNHMEDAADTFKADGKPEEESIELALKAFGPPEEIASELVKANTGRMKLRAIVRLILRAALVPLAVFVALYIGIGRFWASRQTEGFEPTTGYLPPPKQTASSLRLNEHKALIFFGDRTRKGRAEQQRAIWEAHPESKVYYGNYISSLLSAPGMENLDEDTMHHMELELRRGMELDPDNARYNYLLAAMWADKAAHTEEYRENGAFGDLGYVQTFIVDDSGLLDKAIKEAITAGEKPYLKRYAQDMLKERLALLPEPDTFEDLMYRIHITASVITPDFSRYRQIVRTMMLYAEKLAQDGHPEKALPFLDAWFPLTVGLNEDAFTLIDILVVPALAGAAGKTSPKIYRELGMTAQAELAQKRADAFSLPVKHWREARKTDDDDPSNQAFWAEFKQSAGVMTSLLIPVLGQDAADVDLAPGRELEHVLLERVGLSFFLLWFLLMMLGALVIALRWRFAKGGASAPILLLPNWDTTARILGLGVLLPMAVFYVYTRWSGIAGREFSPLCLWPRFMMEILLLSAAMLYISLVIAGRAVKKRCLDIGINVPKPNPRWQNYIIPVVLAALWLVCLIWRGGTPDVLAALAGAFGVVLLIYQIALLIALLVRALYGGGNTGLYYGTLARSIIPMLAATTILVALSVKPYLTYRESSLIRKDPVFAIDPEHPGLTAPEIKLTLKLREEIKEAVKALH